MENIKDSDWYKSGVAELMEEYGTVPPPWVLAPNGHPYSMMWRMGYGQTHILIFGEWMRQECPGEASKIAYFKKFPPPPRWLSSMVSYIWDVDIFSERAEDYASYFKKLDELGFSGTAEFEQDLNDEKWLEY